MKAAEIRELTVEDIIAKIEQIRDEYTKLRINHAVTAIESPATIRIMRKEIARLETILREKELEELINQN